MKKKYNKEIVKDIITLVEQGVFNKDAAQAVGVGESTLYEWVNKYPEFQEQLKKANAQRKTNFIRCIAEAANQQWQAAAWYLERVYNTEFARRRIQEHEGELNIKNLTDEELDEIIKEDEPAKPEDEEKQDTQKKGKEGKGKKKSG